MTDSGLVSKVLAAPLAVLLAVVLIGAGGYISAKRGLEEALIDNNQTRDGWHNASLPDGHLADHFYISQRAMVMLRTTGGDLYARYINYRKDDGWVQMTRQERGVWSRMVMEMAGAGSDQGWTSLVPSPILQERSQVGSNVIFHTTLNITTASITSYWWMGASGDGISKVVGWRLEF